MSFTTRDILWLTALVAMGLAWWLDIRRRDGAVESAQLRKDYYNLMSELVAAETKQLRESNELLRNTLNRERREQRERDNASGLKSAISP